MERSERARGAVWGLVWGDVFGCPVESWSADQVAAVYGSYTELPQAHPLETIREAAPKAMRWLRPLGLHSDDTQQALALLRVAASGGGVEEWGELLVAGKRRLAWRGTGRYFEAAVRRLGRGASPERAGSVSAGIGAAMRVGAVAAWGSGRPEWLEEFVWETALVTHRDVRAAAVAFAAALATAWLVEGAEVGWVRADLAGAVEVAERRWLEDRRWRLEPRHAHAVSGALRRALARPVEDAEDVRRLVSGGQPRASVNSGFSLLGGVHALVQGLREAEPAQVLAEIAQAGDDTDTVAAIAGACLGARFGVDWIPRAQVLDVAAVDRYADWAAGVGSEFEGEESFLGREAQRSIEERAFQREIAGRKPPRVPWVEGPSLEQPSAPAPEGWTQLEFWD